MKRYEGAWKNPVMVKEIRTRMRARRAFIVLTSHLLFLGLTVGLAYLLIFSSASSIRSFDERRTLGKVVFGVVIGLELIVVSFVAPALTASAISAERERQTFDLLRVTLLSAPALVAGKYASAIVFTFLLLFTAIPFLSPALTFGGVSIEEITIGILVLAVTAISFSAIGIMFSSLMKRTLVATVLAYALAIVVTFGIPLLSIIALAAFGELIFANNLEQLSISARTILLLVGWLIVSLSPVATIVASEIILVEQQNALYATLEVSTDLTLHFLSPWILYVTIYTLLSIIVLLISIRLVRRIEK